MRFALLLACICFNLTLSAQRSVKIYYNVQYEEVDPMIHEIYRLGSQDGQGRMHGYTEDYYKSGTLKCRGFFNHGEKVGIWEDCDGELVIEKHLYRADSLIFSIPWIRNKQDTLYVHPDQPAKPINLDQPLSVFLQSVEYPTAALDKRLKAFLAGYFVIHRTGKLGEIEITQSSGYSVFDKAMQQHIRKLDAFEPAMHEGRPVDMKVPFQVYFHPKKGKRKQ
jgi:TonB family protein